MNLPPVNIHKLGFKPTDKEMEEAKEIISKLFKKCEGSFSTDAINRKAKWLIRSTRIFDIVSHLVQQMTYEDKNGNNA
jgi:hypothetical protein